MQSGIDTSRTRIAALETQGETRINVYPDTPAKSTDLFGKDGLTFGDVLDAINPLNHIPIVSDIVKEQTGASISPVSRMVGGALLGGPIGFVASLASVIFEDATGQSPAEAVYAALTGTTEPATQLARAETETATTEQMAEVIPAEEPEMPEQLAALAPSAPPLPAPIAIPANVALTDGKAVLDLYGSSTGSAHASYKKAQLRSYLQDVTTSKVL